MNPCCICGEMPTIEKIYTHWWNVSHEICNGESGVSIANSPSADHAVKKWNRWQMKVASGKVAVVRIAALEKEGNESVTNCHQLK